KCAAGRKGVVQDEVTPNGVIRREWYSSCGLDPRIHPLSEKFLRRWMDCRVKPGNDSGDILLVGSRPAMTAVLRFARPARRSERNQQVYKMTAGAISLFRDCYLQWLAQLHVGSVRAHMSPRCVTIRHPPYVTIRRHNVFWI